MLNWDSLFSSEQKAFREGSIRDHRKQVNKNTFIFNSQKLCPHTELFCHCHSSPKTHASVRNMFLENVQEMALGTEVLSSPVKLTQGAVAVKFSFPFAANVPWL